MVNVIKEVDYVGRPGDLSINARYEPKDRELIITFNINFKKAFSASYYFDPTGNIEEFHIMIIYACDSLFKSITESEFEDLLPASELMKGKNIHRRLKAVYTKGGKQLWTA